MYDGNNDHPYYSLHPEGLPLFPFGKAIGKTRGDFKREDLTRTLLTTFTTSLAQSLYWIAENHGCRRIFIGGGLFNHSVIRDEMMKNYFTFNTFRTWGKKRLSELHFLRHGQYLGALGALLENEKYYATCQQNTDS